MGFHHRELVDLPARLDEKNGGDEQLFAAQLGLVKVVVAAVLVVVVAAHVYSGEALCAVVHLAGDGCRGGSEGCCCGAGEGCCGGDGVGFSGGGGFFSRLVSIILKRIR